MDAVPEISVLQLAERLRTQDPFVLLDVREDFELAAARLQDPRLRLAPMSALARAGVDALPAEARASDTELLILCHHGNRSGQVAAWLSARGWTRVFSVAGGIDEYARLVDPSVGSY